MVYPAEVRHHDHEEEHEIDEEDSNEESDEDSDEDSEEDSDEDADEESMDSVESSEESDESDESSEESKESSEESKESFEESKESSEEPEDISGSEQIVKDNSDDLVDQLEEEVTASPDLEQEYTTSDSVQEETTFMPAELYHHEEANPARENEDVPLPVENEEVVLDSSWEQKDIIIRQKVNHQNCMEMNNDLFIHVMSTLYTTFTHWETVSAQGVNTVLFKSEGGCLPSNVNEVFSSSCV